jgi:hypothetical protein
MCNKTCQRCQRVTGKDDGDKLNQAEEWLGSVEASTDQKIAAREYVMYIVLHADVPCLRQRAMAIAKGTGML